MRSSDTPATEPAQGPADWSREIPSDDQLSPDVRARIRRILDELERRRADAGGEP